MRAKFITFALSAVLFTMCFPAAAQQPTKVTQIGVLAVPSASFIATRIGAFRQALRELGYLEGKNISIEYRYAEGNINRLPELAARNWFGLRLM